MGILDYLGLGDENGQGAGRPRMQQPSAPEAASEASWLARMTVLPDSDSRGQWNAIASGLGNAAVAMAEANRADGYGRPNLGNIIAQGGAGFSKGLGLGAMQRQREAVEATRRKLLAMQLAEAGQSGFGRGLPSSGGQRAGGRFSGNRPVPGMAETELGEEWEDI